MAIYNKRVKLTKENLIDHYLIRNSVTDFIYGLIRLIGIIIQNIYCVSSYLVLSWIVLLPISWIKIGLYSKAENYLYNSLLFIVSSWSLAAGATVVETGEDYKHLIEEPDDNFVEQNKIVPLNKNHSLIKDKQPLANGHSNHNNTKSSSIEDKTSRLESTLKDETDRINTNNLKSNNINNNNHSKNSNASGDSIILEKSENDLIRNTNGLDTTNCSKINHNNNDSNFARKLRSNCVNDSKVQQINVKLSNNQHQQQTVNNNNNVTQQQEQIITSTTSDSTKKPRVLLLCNHVSTADVPLIMQSFSSLTNQSLLWVLDAQFKPTNFGLVCSSHGDFFIAKDSFKDGSLRDQALKHPDRNLFVLFPEGGFWRKRLEGSNRYALKNGLPMTRYVTHPRFGAFKDLIDPSVEITHIVDATLLYDDIRNPLSILDIALGTRKEPAILDYKVYKRSEINPTEEWLRNIWLEKDKLLQQYYEDRSSVYKRFESAGMRAAKLDWFKLLSVHLFYLLVCYLTIYRLFSATSVTMLKARDLYYSNI